jgi:hypothetical protein
MSTTMPFHLTHTTEHTVSASVNVQSDDDDQAPVSITRSRTTSGSDEAFFRAQVVLSGTRVTTDLRAIAAMLIAVADSMPPAIVSSID